MQFKLPYNCSVKRYWPAAIAATVLISGGHAYAQTGNGLQGVYTAGTTTLTRTDADIYYDWGTVSPATGIPGTQYSVTWTGQLSAPVTGNYVFTTQSSAGIRVSLAGQMVIDDWTAHTAKTDVSAAVPLVAGQKYNLVVSYFQASGSSEAHLSWTYPGQAIHTVPQSRLYSTPVTTAPPAPPANTTPPAAPTAISATGVWSNCCYNGLPMSHVLLAWTPGTKTGAPAASCYNVYRNSTLIAQGLTSANFADMTVIPGQQYVYNATAVAATGSESTHSSNVSETAPFPAVVTVAPTNLRIVGSWVAALGLPTDVLTWDAVPGAASYNVYQYNQLIAKGVTATSYTVPTSLYVAAETYTVTAVDATSNETLPSNITISQGALNPLLLPSWLPAAPSIPTGVVAVGEWNAGWPRTKVTWSGGGGAVTSYNVYRDGKKVATGITTQVYYDNDVNAAQTHTYAVTAVNVPWSKPVESLLSLPATGTSPVGPPVSVAGTAVTITKIVPNDDSVTVFFNAVPGAADYRIFDPANPGIVKYSGGGLSIEFNGCNPAPTTKLIVQALDKLGPFQAMDGVMGPGAVMPGMTMENINGQGDPSDLPNVLAASAPFSFTFSPRTLTGAQAFFDNFQNETPLVKITPPTPLSTANYGDVVAVANKNWTIYNVLGDLKNSTVFFMGNHFMDTLYDGGTPGGDPGGDDPLHDLNGSIVLQPNATADITGGKVLHVTFEVDAHNDNRRWIDVFVGAAGDPLLEAGKFYETGGNDFLPTVSGNMFRWEIKFNMHDAQIFQGWKTKGIALNATELFDELNGVGTDNFGPAARVTWNGIPVLNGTTQDLDKRHKFDLYLSQNRFVVEENGTVVKNEVFPNGVTLPFSKCQVYFVHEVYHTANDHPELIQYYPTEKYWINERPWCDEKHWDNIGFEVLTAFPIAAP